MTFLLHRGLDHSAEKHPDTDAFRCWGVGLTYADLVQRANQLANTLIAHGVRRRDRVGIYLNKSLETAVAVYGIWKAGGAYVPIDPNSPASRVAWIMQDCGINHLITAENKRGHLADCCTGKTIIGITRGTDMSGATCLTWDDIATASTTAPTVAQMEDDLAYIMYTSGSTGTPKGMMHTHRSGLAYAKMSGKLYGVQHGDILSNHAPLHFDISTMEYMTGPLHGATTVIMPEMAMMMPASLSKIMEDERVTFWYSVPFALIQLELRGALDERDLSSLRYVLYGGEPFPPKYLRALQQRWPHATFHNVYGPAEVNQCTYYELPPIAEGDETPIPIGQTPPNYDGLILDDADQEADEGELVMRTASMMHGYWNRPDLNANVFYEREILPEFTETYLRTGDLVRRDADGILHFLGRKDRQVKVRGFRVELDEVENALAAHSVVEEAAAFVVDQGENIKEIYAAVILSEHGEAVSAENLIQHCIQSLPHYAVPSKVELRDSFPRTTSGKINRRTLAEQAMSTHASASV